MTPTCLLWESHLHQIQPVHGQCYILISSTGCTCFLIDGWVKGQFVTTIANIKKVFSALLVKTKPNKHKIPNMHTHSYIYIYIYTHTYRSMPNCIYVYIYIYISLNNIDMVCLHIFVYIPTSCWINFIVSGGNLLMKHP